MGIQTKLVWATDAAYPSNPKPWSEASNKTEPSSGQKAEGYEPGQHPPAQVENWLKNRVDLTALGAVDVRRLVPGPRADSSKAPDSPATDGTIPTAYAYAARVGSAQARQGVGSVNMLGVSAGVLFQLVDGDLLAYEFDGTDEVAISAGNGTHWRTDIVQMRLYQDSGQIALDLQVKNGDATGVFPDPDAGYVSLFAITVGKDYDASSFAFNWIDNSSTDSATVHDLRMPINVKRHVVYAKDGIYDAAVWEPQALSRSLKCNTASGGAENRLFVPCPTGTGRLLGVAFVSKNADNASSVYLCSLQEPDGRGDPLADVKGLCENTAAMTYHGGGFDLIEYTSNSPSFPFNAGSLQGPPVWCDGLRATQPFGQGSTDVAIGGSVSARVGVDFYQVVNREISLVVFYVAEGL